MSNVNEVEQRRAQEMIQWLRARAERVRTTVFNAPAMAAAEREKRHAEIVSSITDAGKKSKSIAPLTLPPPFRLDGTARSIWDIGPGTTQLASSTAQSFSTPYEYGSDFLVKSDGKMILVGVDHYTMAAVGFNFTVSEPRYCAITPAGTFKWSWANFSDAPHLRHAGGVGINVYGTDHANPLLSRQMNLFTVNGAAAFTAASLDGILKNAVPVDFDGTGFGPVPLAPLYFSANAGQQYFITVWCYMNAVEAPASPSAYLSTMEIDVPSVSVEVSVPPPPPH